MTITDIFIPSAQTESATLFPKVTAQPHLVVWSVATHKGEATAWMDRLYQLLPAYWQSDGIIDCKLMLAKNQSLVLVIESWESQASAAQFRSTQVWRNFLTDNPGISADTCGISKLIDNTFELIE